MDYIFSEKVTLLQPSAIREILKYTADPEVIPFAAGNPSQEAFPVEDISRISQEIFSENPILALQYSVTEGYTLLRNELKKMMKKQNCFNEEQDELIITSGAQQGNELCCKVLCDEGDTLICEAPSFIGSLNSFKSYNVNLLGVPLEKDGINLEMLEETLRSYPNTKLLYLIPNFQNPTGQTMSYEKRVAVYKLAQKYDICILEDNPYGDTRFEGEAISSIKSMDTDGRVIYTGTFSKTLAPGLRVGFVSGPKAIIQKIVVCKQVADVHTNIWAQTLCYKFLTEVNFDKHIEDIRKIYKRKCHLMLDEIEKNFPSYVKYTKPEGGLFIWITLPENSDMMEFCRRAVKEFKVAVVPGNAFLINDDDPTTSFRMNFSTPSDERIIKGCEILGKLIKEMFGE